MTAMSEVDSPAGFKLLPVIRRALGESLHPDPGKTAHHALMLIPVEQREAALLRSLEVCCYVAAAQIGNEGLRAMGVATPVQAFEGCPTDW